MLLMGSSVWLLSALDNVRSLTITEKTVVQHISGIYQRLDIADTGDDHRRVLVVLRHLVT